MKAFIYGRYDVLADARGYRVFGCDSGIPDSQLQSLDRAFSTEDPSPQILQQIGTFPVYFPLESGTWVLGKGQVEHRGNYYSYILHGLLLNPKERAGWQYNPWPLLHSLQPNIGNRRELPPLKPVPIEADQYLPRALQNVTTGQPESLAQLSALGAQLMEALPADKPLFSSYQSTWDADYLCLLYAMLPPVLRAELSLTGLASFLNPATTWQWGLQAPRGCIALEPKATSLQRTFAQFLEHTLRRNPSQHAEAFQLLEDAYADAQDLFNLQIPLADKLETSQVSYSRRYVQGVLKGLENPTASALKTWTGIPAFQRMFGQKCRHFIRIWKRNGADAEYFPNLAGDILASLIQDYDQLKDQLTPAGRLEIQSQFDQVVAALDATQDSQLAPYLFSDPHLGQAYSGNVRDQILLKGLLESAVPGRRWQAALSFRLQTGEPLPPEFEALADHPFFSEAHPQVHAQMLELMAHQSTRELLQHLLLVRYQAHPSDFEALLGLLTNPKQLLPRIMASLRRLALLDQSGRAGFLQLLEICHRHDPALFRKMAINWLKHPHITRLASAASQSPEALKPLVDLWREPAEADPMPLRYLFILQHYYSDPEIFSSDPLVQKKLKDNPLVQLLFSPSATSSPFPS